MMNYKISFSEMNKLAQEAQLGKPKLSLEDMRKQATASKEQQHFNN
ncbi:hypothetical protein [Mucilaginibacter terrae]|uniref:Uncharacterized protein n=1 Tax=Mucilaginibacter terrae TaxID=1955052 RepID=A0ABU3H004_9SPHI|nr:hypothetical protein [Mucilaginibacter terrae]MDT3404572.1 hypothetical protein [Mucilaginibacter terrae]